MSYILSASSRKKLIAVHPDLVNVVTRALSNSSIEFQVSEGIRTLEKQRELVRIGASKTLNSRHLDGHAVDLFAVVDGQARWDWPLYEKISTSMKIAAAELAVPIEWGGDWRSFKDGPHFQLPFAAYPSKNRSNSHG